MNIARNRWKMDRRTFLRGAGVAISLPWRETGFGGRGSMTLSWTKNHTPLMPEDRPQVVFDRLFRPDSVKELAAHESRSADQKSVLDAVREQARQLEGRLGKSDQLKLAE